MTACTDIKDSHDIRLRRIRYRSWHRGCKETDIILGQFADKALSNLATETELELYEALLSEQDMDIWNWLTGKTSLKDGKYGGLKNIGDYPKKRVMA